MSQKTVLANVYGKEYILACDIGQEQHLNQLIHEVNARATQLEKAVGHLADPMMLLYTALMVADELHDTKRDLATAKAELQKAREQVESVRADDTRLADLEEEVAENLHAIAARMESLADRLTA